MAANKRKPTKRVRKTPQWPVFVFLASKEEWDEVNAEAKIDKRSRSAFGRVAILNYIERRRMIRTAESKTA